MIKSLLQINQIDLKNQTVLCRVDFNVPLTSDGQVANQERIIATLPTIKYLLKNNCKIILLSHLGRIKTKDDCKTYTLAPVAKCLATHLNKPVNFVNATKGPLVEKAISTASNNSVILLENTRFEDLDGKKESGCDLSLAQYWASLGDVFVNDAFGTCHRKHASNYGISSFIEKKCVGFLILSELAALNKILNKPTCPFYLVLGGAKIADKVGVIDSLAPKADKIIIGGAMAYAFLSAQDYKTGSSMLDKKSVEIARLLLCRYKDKLVLPCDHKVATSFTNAEAKNTISVNIDDGYMGLDIGTKTVALFENELAVAKTIFWNGPVGVYEFSNYRKGTLAVAKTIAKLKSTAYTVVGGGDSVAAVTELKLISEFSFVSTGGGASLYYLSSKDMPSLKILEK